MKPESISPTGDPEADEALGSGENGLLRRTRPPAEHTFGLFARGAAGAVEQWKQRT
jgi:hypothetical protein